MQQLKAAQAGAALMEAAGARVAEVIMRGWGKRKVAVLCGPGNNGGDGFVVARLLAAQGWEVKVGLLGAVSALKGDAKLMASLYDGSVEPLDASIIDGAELIVDAIFGTGLSRKIEGELLDLFTVVNAHPAPVVAIDLPSGVHTDTGTVLGGAIQATRTVTFLSKKPGHILFPGRYLCGALDIGAIGIEPDDLKALRVDIFENDPRLWGGAFPRPNFQTHKYHRGSVFVVAGGRLKGGAARLSARGALRIGAGLVTVLAPAEACHEHAAQLNAIMLQQADGPTDVVSAFRDGSYQQTTLFGPGAGVSEATRQMAIALAKTRSRFCGARR